MNEHDLGNLEFLRNLSDAGLKAWFEQASEDDVLYAQELLNQWEEQMDRELHGVAYVPLNSTLH